MIIPEAIVPFWRLAAAALGPDALARLYDISFFGDNESSANHLAQLVVAGQKRATAGLVWSFEHDGKSPPQAGALSVVTNWGGEPMCVIETTSVSVVPFDKVDAQFAAAEGEGDETLGYWQQVHWAYFGRECVRIGRRRTSTMPIVCEHFEVVYKA